MIYPNGLLLQLLHLLTSALSQFILNVVALGISISLVFYFSASSVAACCVSSLNGEYEDHNLPAQAVPAWLP